MSHSSSRPKLTSSSRPKLAPSVQEALLEAIKLKLPPGHHFTLEAAEMAVHTFLKELGPPLMEDLLNAPKDEAKKGGLLSVVENPPAIKE